MDGLQDSVDRIGDHRFLLAGVGAPKHEHDGIILLIHKLDHSIGELLPTATSMAIGTALSHGQSSVQEQNTLLCPAGKVALTRHGNAEIAFQLLVDVHKGRGQFDAALDGEAEPMCLANLVIRVLP